MKLLIVGQLDGALISAAKIVADSGVKVFHSPSIEEAMHLLLSGQQVDVMLVDIRCNIADLVQQIKSQRMSVCVVACGLDHSKAVHAIKAGAIEYLPLPPEKELIAAILSTIAEHQCSKQFIAQSKEMVKIFNVAKQVSQSEATILITGQSGTGKEVVAQYIHANSKRKDNDMIAINCAAIPENLLESELFGHEKGSFTGASERRIGKFESANGSTILLDEVTEMSKPLQAKILRVLQEKEISRLGANANIKVNARVIATSNRDVMQYVKSGDFREDLFYRLNVINIHIPSLSQRIDDIIPLAEYFLQKYSDLNCIDNKSLSDGAKNKLKSHHWPGNVRELENCMHRSLLLAPFTAIEQDDVLLIQDVNAEPSSLADIEKGAIYQAMVKSQGDQLKAALILGLSTAALKRKLKLYKIQ